MAQIPRVSISQRTQSGPTAERMSAATVSVMDWYFGSIFIRLFQLRMRANPGTAMASSRRFKAQVANDTSNR